jgi:hypothetical protein
MVAFVTVLVGLAKWVMRPYDIAGTVGAAFGVLVIAFVVAGLIQAWSRKKNWNWDSFARWYFWLALGLLILSSPHPRWANRKSAIRRVYRCKMKSKKDPTLYPNPFKNKQPARRQIQEVRWNMKDNGVALSNLGKQAMLVNLTPEQEQRVMELIAEIKAIFDQSSRVEKAS